MDLVDQIYDLTMSWPGNEAFGLTSQIRRAAVSIPANIAEGQGRNGDREFVHHLGIAYGSLCEVETLISIARRRELVLVEQEETTLQSTARLAGLIHGLMRSLRNT
jgi:four helix bundle protein